jgi:YesN/AraC family two-component response regulator
MLSIKELKKLTKNLTILYVEDNKDTQSELKELLDELFLCTLTANNGKEGLKTLKTTNVDLILSDINMPKCNGLDMIRNIKQIYPQIPTILLSGYGNSEHLLKSIEIGVNKYLMKPMNKEKLFQSIEEMAYLINSRKKYKLEQIGLSKNIKMIAIAKLLDNLSHQWRQNLSIISTSVSAVLLNENMKVSSNYVKELLLNVNEQVKQMDNLLKDLFDNYNKEYNIQQIKLNKLVHSSLNPFQSSIEKNNIDIRLDIKEEITLFTNVESLKQVLHNLIENAIESIILNKKQDAYIQITANVKNDKLIIDIIDNGGGINALIKDDIFEPYTTTKHSFIGTGLGLYIVYILTTKSLKGDISNSNLVVEKDRCAKFRLSLSLK